MVIAWSSLLALLSGHLVGLSLGATGAGGALIAVPLLVYVLGRSVQEAVAISLIIVGLSAFLGALGHLRSKEISLRVALLFGATGAPGAWVGARAHALVKDEWVLLLFGLLMLAVSIHLLWNGPLSRPVPGNETARYAMTTRHAAELAGVGLLIGCLTGFFGVGGGFLIVPALIFFAGFPIRVAIGTSLLITALMSIAGIAGHLQQGMVDLELVAVMVAGSAAGLLVGAKVAAALTPARLARSFALFTLVVSISLIAHSGLALVQREGGADERPGNPNRKICFGSTAAPAGPVAAFLSGNYLRIGANAKAGSVAAEHLPRA